MARQLQSGAAEAAAAGRLPPPASRLPRRLPPCVSAASAAANAGFQNHFWRHPLILEGMPPLAAGMPAAAGGGFRRRLPRCRRRLPGCRRWMPACRGGFRAASAASRRHPGGIRGIRAASAASGRHPRLPGGFQAASAPRARLPSRKPWRVQADARRAAGGIRRRLPRLPEADAGLPRRLPRCRATLKGNGDRPSNGSPYPLITPRGASETPARTLSSCVRSLGVTFVFRPDAE